MPFLILPWRCVIFDLRRPSHCIGRLCGGNAAVIDQGRVTTAVKPVGHRYNRLQIIDAAVHGSRPNQREGRWNVWDKGQGQRCALMEEKRRGSAPRSDRCARFGTSNVRALHDCRYGKAEGPDHGLITLGNRLNVD